MDRKQAHEEAFNLLTRCKENGCFAEIVELLLKVTRLQRELAEARRQQSGGNICWTCGGSPHPSGLTCICGGSGFHVDEISGLRMAALKAEQQIASLTQERDSLRVRFADEMQRHQIAKRQRDAHAKDAEALRQALEPFVEEANKWDHLPARSFDGCCPIDKYRKARAALGASTTAGDK